MPEEQRPNAGYIEDYATHYGRVWSNTHLAWKAVDALYHRTYAIWEPGLDRSEYRPSTPTNVIDHAADTQLAFEPRFHRQPVGMGDANKEAADRVEKALGAVFADSALKETVLPWKQLGRHLLHYGYGVVEGPMLDYTARPVVPKKLKSMEEDEFKSLQTLYKSQQHNWNPIRYRAINPGRVLLDPYEKEPSFAIKRSKETIKHLKELSWAKKEATKSKTARDYRPVVNLFENPKQKKDFETEELIHYWTAKWHTVKIRGLTDILWTERNIWGFVPYGQAFAGFGMEPVSLDDMDPQYLATGLLTPIDDSIVAQAQRMSADHQLLIRTAYAQLITEGEPSELALQMAREGIIQGDKEGYGILPTPAVQGWMLEVGKGVDADIERGSYTQALSGMRQEGVTTVGQEAILSTAARKKFAAPAIQLQNLATLTASRVLRLVDVMDDTIKDFEGIGADGLVLKPGDIRHDYNVKATFEVLDPVLEMQRRQLGMQEVAAGLKSWETYQEEDARRANITQERNRILEDAVRRSPGVIDRMATEVAKMMDMEKEFTGGAQEIEPGAEGGVDSRQQPVTPTQQGEQVVEDRMRKMLTPEVGNQPRVPQGVM